MLGHHIRPQDTEQRGHRTLTPQEGLIGRACVQARTRKRLRAMV